MPDYKDISGLQFIKFDFVAGGQEIKIAILPGECLFVFFFLTFLAIILSF